jgi:hypothetical protein
MNRLTEVRLVGSQVTDLSPLKDSPIKKIRVPGTVTDLLPLRTMPLEEYVGPFDPARDAAILRQIKTLKTINGQPAPAMLK